MVVQVLTKDSQMRVNWIRNVLVRLPVLPIMLNAAKVPQQVPTDSPPERPTHGERFLMLSARVASHPVVLAIAIAALSGCRSMECAPGNLYDSQQVAYDAVGLNEGAELADAPTPNQPALVGQEPLVEAAGLSQFEPVWPIESMPPRELSKAFLPAYRIEPPDILLIEAVQVVPRQPYHLQTGDVLAIQVPGAFAEAPIAGAYPVGLGGMVNLGVPYGSVKVSGKTIEEAERAVIDHLKNHLTEEALQLVTVSLSEITAKQQIQGQHLVGPDGKVNLGVYGSVPVVGMTLPQAKAMIEAHLSQFLEKTEVAVDVYSYNSKVFYVITQGAGMGDSVVRIPFMGNETVLDAIAQVNGLGQVSSKTIWIARPGRNQYGQVQVLPVDWNAITQYAGVETNYQIFPGDRIFIAEDKRVSLDTSLAKTMAPLERLMGFAMLGTQTISRFSGTVLSGGGIRGFYGGGGGP